MIIDAHCHLINGDWLPEKWWLGLAKVAVPVLEKMGMTGITEEAVLNDILPAFFFDPTGDKQLAAMEEAGIDMAAVFPLDYGLALGEPPMGIEEVNKLFADLGQKYPDKFIPFCSVDPRRPGAADLVKKALEEWGMKGLKLHASTGFYPSGPEARAVLDVIRDKNVPVVNHTGGILQPLYTKYCDPLWLDEVCVDYPDLTFVAAHLGHGFRDQVLHIGACKTNLWTDMSDWQRRAAHEYGYFCESLRAALDNFSPERVMFGTDGPYLRNVMTDAAYVQLFKDLPEKAPDGISFTQDEIDAVLGGNAARLFGIE